MALEKKLVFVLTKCDMVPEDEVGVLRNKLSKVCPTLTFRQQDESFLQKLKKAFSSEEGEKHKGKL